MSITKTREVFSLPNVHYANNYIINELFINKTIKGYNNGILLSLQIKNPTTEKQVISL